MVLSLGFVFFIFPLCARSLLLMFFNVLKITKILAEALFAVYSCEPSLAHVAVLEYVWCRLPNT